MVNFNYWSSKDKLFYERNILETRFPTLVFNFFMKAEHHGIVVRVVRRTDKPVVVGQYHEELIPDAEWDSWPTEGFIARCCLIA